MAYQEKRVAEQLAACWDRPDLGASSAWLDLEAVEDTTAPDRPAIALEQCAERLRMRALPHRLGDDLPVTLRAPGAPPRRRQPAPPRCRVPHPAVLSAIYGDSSR